MIMLRGVKYAFEIIDGRLNMPDQPAVGAADEANDQFRSVEAFNKAEDAALQITSHMSIEIYYIIYCCDEISFGDRGVAWTGEIIWWKFWR